MMFSFNIVHSRQWVRKCVFRNGVLVGIVALCSTLLSVQAQADPTDDAVKAFVHTGKLFGVPIGQTEVDLIKAIVRCAVNNTPVVNCARREAVLKLPAAARPIADCLLQRNPNAIAECASEQALQQLPDQRVRAVVVCLRKPEFGRCGGELAASLNADQRLAFALIDKLKADSRVPLLETTSSGTIRNIIATSEGIRDDDWVKVLGAAGTEVYKTAATVVVKKVAPFLAPLGPFGVDAAIEAIVQHRADLLSRLARGARNGDVPAITEAALEGYLTANLVVPCKLPIIPEDVRTLFCTAAGDVIRAIADAGGTIVSTVLNIIKPLVKLATELFDGFIGAITGKDRDCEPPQQWYAMKYAKCYHRALAKPQQVNALVESLDNVCHNRYRHCFHSDQLPGLCEPQNATFRSHVGQLTSSMSRAAILYKASFETFARTHRERACRNSIQFLNAEYKPFLERCAQALAVQFPMRGDADSNACWDAPPRMSPVAHRMACEQALKRSDAEAIVFRMCRPPTVTPTAPLVCRAEPGVCGDVDITCQRPLPPTDFLVRVQGIASVSVKKVDREIGWIWAGYNYAGTFAASVCAKNTAGEACSESFELRLGSTTDWSLCGARPQFHRGHPDTADLVSSFAEWLVFLIQRPAATKNNGDLRL